MKRTALLRRTRLRSVSRKRSKETSAYAKVRAKWLAAHPFCQIAIARLGLDEADVIEFNGYYEDIYGCFSRVALATTIHHRNKSRGARLTDTRWFMSASLGQHDYVEANKGWARDHGFLLPLNADADGNLPDGSRALETPAFMASKVTL